LARDETDKRGWDKIPIRETDPSTRPDGRLRAGIIIIQTNFILMAISLMLMLYCVW
jgi:hypothetical protein